MRVHGTSYITVDGSSLNPPTHSLWQECWEREEDYTRDKRRFKLLLVLLVFGVLMFFAIFNYLQVKAAREDIGTLQRAVQGLTESLQSVEATVKLQKGDVTALQASLIQLNAEIIMLKSCSPCNH